MMGPAPSSTSCEQSSRVRVRRNGSIRHGLAGGIRARPLLIRVLKLASQAGAGLHGGSDEWGIIGLGEREDGTEETEHGDSRGEMAK